MPPIVNRTVDAVDIEEMTTGGQEEEESPLRAMMAIEVPDAGGHGEGDGTKTTISSSSSSNTASNDSFRMRLKKKNSNKNKIKGRRFSILMVQMASFPPLQERH